MSRFITELDIKCCSDESLWELENPLVYDSDLLGVMLTVPKGFITDLASVPRIPFIFDAWGNRAHREAVVHDYLNRMDSEPVVLFSAANAVFREAMEVRDKSWSIRWALWSGVWIGGYFSYHKKRVDWKPGDDPPVCIDSNAAIQP